MRPGAAPWLGPAVALALLAVVAVALAAAGDPGEDWVVDDHQRLEGVERVLDGNVTVVDGGWLELVGAALVFNSTSPGEHTLRVLEGGRLTTAASGSGVPSEVRPLDPGNGTGIQASWAAGLSLEHLVMRDCGYIVTGPAPEPHSAIVVRGTSGVVIRSSEFRNCLGVSLETCPGALVEGCTFVDTRGASVYLLSSSGATVRDCTVRGGNVGIDVMMSTDVTLTGNDVSALLAGIQVSRSDGVAARDDTVSVTGLRGILVSYSKLCVLEGCTVRGTPSMFPGSVGVLLQDCSYVTVRGCDVQGTDTGVDVRNSDRFGTAHDHLSGNVVANCTVAVHVASAGNALTGNAIGHSGTGVLVDSNYSASLSADPSGNALSGGTVEGCGLGVHLDGALDTLLRGCGFRSNGRDVLASGSDGSVEENGTHEGWGDCAVEAVGGDYGARWTVLSGGGTALRLSGGARLTLEQSSVDLVDTTVVSTGGSALVLVNTTHPRVYDLDAGSTVDVLWDVEVTVRVESDPDLRPSGTITVTDVGSAEVLATGFRMDEGPALLVVLEVSVRGSVADNRTPHTLVAEAMDRAAGTTVPVTAFRRIVLTIDDVPPTLVLLRPAEGTTNASLVAIEGHAEDNSSGPVAVEVLVDGTHLWNGSDSWTLSTELGDGSHVLDVFATDASGNQASARRRFAVDTTPPELTIEFPPGPEHRTAADEVTVVGTLRDGVSLTVDGEPVPVELGRFQHTLPLPVDGTYRLNFLATDGHGNSVERVLSVTRDTSPPALELDDHPSLTTREDLTVHGRTDAGAIVTVDGVVVEVSPDGGFELVLSLGEGANAFVVAAVDDLGNRNSTRLEVVLDTVALLEVVSPLNGTRFQVQDIEVVLRVEPGGRARLEGGEWRDADESGYARIGLTLREGTTEVRVQAEDGAGNEASASLTVHYIPTVHTEEDDWPLLLAIAVGVVAALVLAIHLFREQRGGD